LWAAAAAVVLHQTCQLANRHCGQDYAKAAFGEQVQADAVDVTITKVFQTLCIGHVTCACVLAVVNTMSVAEQHLKSGHGTMCIQ
jgi:hypothetical protein